MLRILDVRPLEDHRVWVRYEDGTEGDIDLSHLVGQGVFKAWDGPIPFDSVSIGACGQLCWGEGIDLCPDALYMVLTGKPAHEVFPALKKSPVDA